MRSFVNQASNTIHTTTPVAVAMFVLMTAAASAGPRVVRVTAVEPVPAQPQDAGTDPRHDQVVGQGVLSISEQPRPEDPGGDKAGYAGGHVDDVPTREVQRPSWAK